MFLLWHSHDLGDGETDDKLIGVYSSEAEAKAAKARKLQYEGFRDAPDDFLVDKYELDVDQWSEGYLTWSRPTGSEALPSEQDSATSGAPAERVLNIVLRHSAEQDALLAKIRASCSDDEFNWFKQLIGRVMGAMLIEAINPIVDRYPDLKPPELR